MQSVLNEAEMTKLNLEHPPVRLSQSCLWQMQRKFFEQQGIEAWRQNIVPSYVTTNPFIAHAYAQVVLGFLEDCAVEQQVSAERRETEEPIYIVELGAGSGRFAYHFLKQFLPEYEERELTGQKICYVMTDISWANINFWKSHEQLQKYVEQGVLDFAYFDACEDRVIELLVSERVIGAEGQTQPVVAIANYVFDSIPQDVFEIKDGQLYECLVTLERGEDTGDEGEIEDVELNYQLQPCSSNYYADTTWNGILKDYLEQLNNTAFLFPVGALQCLANLKVISRGRLLLLSGDKGYHLIDVLKGKRKPQLVVHGSFSLDVNYHALAKYVEQGDGQVLQVAEKPSYINVLAFVFGKKQQAFRYTKQAFRQQICEFSPSDFFNFKKGLQNNYSELSLNQIISLLKLSHWDTKVLLICYPRLLEVLPNAKFGEDQDFLKIIQLLWEHYFILEEEQNPVFQIGTLLAVMHFYQDAIVYYQRAKYFVGESARIEFNLGLCSWYLGMKQEACRYLYKALELDKDLPMAELFIRKISISLSSDSINTENTKLKQLEKYAFIQEQLRNPDITLEPLTPIHAEAFYRYATPEIMKLTMLPEFLSVEEVLKWIHGAMQNLNQYTFAILHRNLNFIGIISVTIRDQSGHFFYWLGESFWGNSYATIATCHLVRFVCENLVLKELSTHVLSGNYRSNGIINKLGFSPIGQVNYCNYYKLYFP